MSISQQITLGSEARLAVITYSDNSSLVASLPVAYDTDKLLFLIGTLESRADAADDVSGFNSALDAASLELEPSIASRLVDWTTREQALILLKFSDVGDAATERARNLLFKLMNTLVRVAVVGKNCNF